MIIFKSKHKKFEGDLKIKFCGKRLYPTKYLQWWKKYLRISPRFKKFQKCPLPLAQCWDRHAFLPQVPTSTTFPTLKVGGGGFFSKYFFQGCLKNFLHSNNVCMYFGGKKIALVDLWKLNNIYNEAIMIFTTSI